MDTMAQFDIGYTRESLTPSRFHEAWRRAFREMFWVYKLFQIFASLEIHYCNRKGNISLCPFNPQKPPNATVQCCCKNPCMTNAHAMQNSFHPKNTNPCPQKTKASSPAVKPRSPHLTIVAHPPNPPPALSVAASLTAAAPSQHYTAARAARSKQQKTLESASACHPSIQPSSAHHIIHALFTD